MRYRSRNLESKFGYPFNSTTRIIDKATNDVISTTYGSSTNVSETMYRYGSSELRDEVDRADLQSAADRTYSRARRNTRTGTEFVVQAVQSHGTRYPARACHHESWKIEGLDKPLDLPAINDDNASTRYEFDFVTTPIGALEHLIGGGLQNLDDVFDSANISSVGAHAPVDWVDLYSKYDEAVTSFIPSDLFLGEALAESSIYFDALKLVLNPSRSILTLINLAKKISGPGHRRQSFGTVAKRVSKASANGWLGFNFAVKPAVEDVLSALSAHQVVKKRMQFLRSNAGSFVHIGVADNQLASTTTILPDPTGLATLFSVADLYKLTARIGCQGRVRKDLSGTDTFDAYLQYFGVNKVLGTVWELIPFSFVVDWFTNTQDVINYFTRKGGRGPFTELRDFCCSTKVLRYDSLRVTGGRMAGFNADLIAPAGGLELCRRVKTEYRRFLELPTDRSQLDFSGLSLFHLLATGSLLIQKLVR